MIYLAVSPGQPHWHAAAAISGISALICVAKELLAIDLCS